MKSSAGYLFGYILLFFCCQSNPYVQGERLYKVYCGNCHMEDGNGLRGLYPPLAQSDYLYQHHADLPCIITKGLQQPIVVNGKTYELPMAPIEGLSSVQIANIINYISHAWGNDAGYTKIQEVEKALTNCGQ